MVVYLIERNLLDLLVANPVRKTQVETVPDLNQPLITQKEVFHFFRKIKIMIIYIVVYLKLDSDYSVELNQMSMLP